MLVALRLKVVIFLICIHSIEILIAPITSLFIFPSLNPFSLTIIIRSKLLLGAFFWSRREGSCLLNFGIQLIPLFLFRWQWKFLGI